MRAIQKIGLCDWRLQNCWLPNVQWIRTINIDKNFAKLYIRRYDMWLSQGSNAFF